MGSPFHIARGLAGHSDADAVAHALTDAILGAAGAGNIGQLFPDTDPQWKDADSMELLRTAHELVRGRGYALAQADLTVITEQPKLGPHLGAMAAALAARLGARAGTVSVKAKTNEGMGFIGRGEGHRGYRGCHPGGPLIESLLAWLSQLPPAAVYAVLALLAAVENVLPPVPSDAAVALGAFLSNRGLTTPLGVFLVTWVANLAGAAGVYFAARRFGRRLFASPTGRRLLAPRSLAVIEREYLRFGTAGIFISRFLPGIRAVVPPFAGLVGLGPAPHARADGRSPPPSGMGASPCSAHSSAPSGIASRPSSRESTGRWGIAAGALIVGIIVWRLLVADDGDASGSGMPRRTRSTRRLPRFSPAPTSQRGPPARPPHCWSWSSRMPIPR